MHLQPSPTWYLYNADGAEPLRLLDDEGRADLALSGTPHGLLASPDSSWVGYEYDAAHREMATSLGNRIELQLDNAGNVTVQNVNDPQGSLARNATRTRDALNRVQQSIGH